MSHVTIGLLGKVLFSLLPPVLTSDLNVEVEGHKRDIDTSNSLWSTQLARMYISHVTN